MIISTNQLYLYVVVAYLPSHHFVQYQELTDHHNSLLLSYILFLLNIYKIYYLNVIFEYLY